MNYLLILFSCIYYIVSINLKTHNSISTINHTKSYVDKLEMSKQMRKAQIKNAQKADQQGQIKMVKWIDALYRKYPILSKITQKQSQQFQNQVILLLVDENENVDKNAYKQVLQNMGLDAFILDVLSKCLNRNPFSNQYQLKKNISSIAQDLQKQSKQLVKKNKVLQRRQQEINQKQSNTRNRIKEFLLQLQKQSVNRIISKQNQVKKNINSSLNNLRLKQKILYDKKQQINRKLVQLVNRQKQLSALNITQKQQIRKQNNPEVNNIKEQIVSVSTNSSKELKQLSKKYQQLKLELERYKKKYKTTEMAYSKIKHDLNEKQKDNRKIKEEIQEVKEELTRFKNKQTQRQRCKQAEKERELDTQKYNLKPRQQGIKQMQARKQLNKPQPINKGENEHEIIDMLQLLQISNIQINEKQDKAKQQNDRITINNVSKQHKRSSECKNGNGNSKMSRNMEMNKVNKNSSMNDGIDQNRNMLNSGKNVQQQQIVELRKPINSKMAKQNRDEAKPWKLKKNISSNFNESNVQIISNSNPNLGGSHRQRLDQQNVDLFNNYFITTKPSSSGLTTNNCAKIQPQHLDYQQCQEQEYSVLIEGGRSNKAALSQSYLYPNHDSSYGEGQVTSKIPQFLTQQQNETAQSILNKIEQAISPTLSSKSISTLFAQNHLVKFIQLPKFKQTKQHLLKYFDVLLSLIQQSNQFYFQAIQNISNSQFIDFFQASYLNYESNLQICEATTLLLSRILMVSRIQIKFNEQFISAIKLRVKVIGNSSNKKSQNDSEDDQNEQFLKANINCLLSMVYV